MLIETTLTEIHIDGRDYGARRLLDGRKEMLDKLGMDFTQEDATNSFLSIFVGSPVTVDLSRMSQDTWTCQIRGCEFQVPTITYKGESLGKTHASQMRGRVRLIELTVTPEMEEARLARHVCHRCNRQHRMVGGLMQPVGSHARAMWSAGHYWCVDCPEDPAFQRSDVRATQIVPLAPPLGLEPVYAAEEAQPVGTAMRHHASTRMLQILQGSDLQQHMEQEARIASLRKEIRVIEWCRSKSINYAAHVRKVGESYRWFESQPVTDEVFDMMIPVLTSFPAKYEICLTNDRIRLDDR